MKSAYFYQCLFLIMSLMFVKESYGQNSVYRQVQAFKAEEGHVVQSNALFRPDTKSTRSDAMDKVIKKATFLTLNTPELKRLNDSQIDKLEMKLPYQRENIELELIRSQLFTHDFTVISDKSRGKPVAVKQGTYFRGIIKNDPNSLVTVSIFDNEVIGIISSDNGNIILGNMNSGTENDYIIYNDRDLLIPFSYECGTPDILPNSDLAEEIKKLEGHRTIGDRTTKCVRMYLELDYTLVTEKGGTQGAVNWMSAVYNQVQALYSIDNITTSISQIFTWTTEDPYNFNSTGEALDKFKLDRPSYNGDLAHLISRGAPFNGGRASIDALCSSRGHAYSWVDDTYANVPTYSWTVNVIAHETGHNFGSPHTHSCNWPGGAIDGCSEPEGTCADGPIPADGGTIMSYCHNIQVGINLNKGFGYYPALLITQKINNASCLGASCTSSAVNTPTAVSASDGTFTDKVQVTWSGNTGNYFRVYRNTTNSSSTSTALGNWQTSTILDDLTATPGITYHYFVRAASNSSGASISAYSTSNSGFRNVAPVVTTPSNVQASDGTFTDRVQVTWAGSSGNYFKVYRSTSNSTTNASVISNWQNTQSYFDDLSAVAGTTYYYFVQAASSSVGANPSAYSVINSGWRSVAPVVTTPSAVDASDGTYTDKVKITWSGTNGNFFRLIRNTSNSTASGTVISNWQNSQLYFDDLTAVAGTTYYYFVQAASSSAGANPSAYSAINSGWRSVAPVVTTPAAIDASDGTYTDKVRVTWSGTSGNYFRIIRNTSNSTASGTVILNWQNAQLYFDDFSAVAGNTYYYFVQAASSSAGANPSAYSVINSGWRSVAPVVTTPAAVDASDGTYTDKVRVTWSGTSGNYFRVIRNTSNSTASGTVILNWQNTQSYFDDFSTVAGTTYYYFVQAASSSVGANPSAYSAINSGWRSVAPVVTTPSAVSASDGTYTDKVRITWSGTSGNYFRLIRNTSNSTASGTVILNWQNSQLYFDDLTAVAGTTYYYFVQAASSSAGANPSAYSAINSGWRSVAPVVTTPSALDASDGTYTDKVRITWSGTSGNYFRLIRNTSNSTASGTVIVNWQNTQSYFDDFSAVAGTTYYYFVQAASSSAGSNASAYSAINSGWRSASCGTVINLAAGQITSASAVLSWSPTNGASQYSVWYYTSNAWTQIGVVSQNSAKISNMSGGIRYCFAIKAICGGSTGNFSGSICFTTPASNLANNSTSEQNDLSESITVPSSTMGTINLYPNPALIYSDLTLEFISDINTTNTIILINSIGNIVRKVDVPVPTGENKIQISAPETPGMYIIQMLSGNESIFIKKIIISEN